MFCGDGRVPSSFQKVCLESCASSFQRVPVSCSGAVHRVSRGFSGTVHHCGEFESVKAINGGSDGRALTLKTPQNVDFVTTSFATMPVARDLQANKLPAPQISNGPQSILGPDTTESKPP